MIAEDVKSWKTARKNAEHYKALGLHHRVWLKSDDLDDYPWDLLTEIEGGGLHRMGVTVSLSLQAYDKEAGLTYAWHVDLEPREANGSGKLQLDMHLIHDVETKLPKALKPKFKGIFQAHIKELRGEEEKATEWLNNVRFNIDVLTSLTERK